MSIEQTVQDNIKRHAGGSYHWSIGDRVTHPDGYLVQITSGYYLDPVYHRVSNFWRWKRVLDDGFLAETEEHGYGW